MNKNLLSIAIIVVAIAIIFINVWKPSSNKKDTHITKGEKVLTDGNITSEDLSDVQEGKPAPDFKLSTLAGKKVKLSDYRGKKVILNFWATWCPPCKAEMPHMQNFYEKNKKNDFEIVAVNLTNMDKGKAEIKNFVNEYKLTFQILLDEDDSIGMQYQAFSIPTSYIIDSNGIIAKKIIGPMDEEMMNNLTKDIN